MIVILTKTKKAPTRHRVSATCYANAPLPAHSINSSTRFVPVSPSPTFISPIGEKSISNFDGVVRNFINDSCLTAPPRALRTFSRLISSRTVSGPFPVRRGSLRQPPRLSIVVIHPHDRPIRRANCSCVIRSLRRSARFRAAENVTFPIRRSLKLPLLADPKPILAYILFLHVSIFLWSPPRSTAGTFATFHFPLLTFNLNSAGRVYTG